MAPGKPKQKRSRERVEKILLAAADELARASSAEDMTTTDVANRSGVPVSTIYRYFADRSAIIAALIDKETAEIDDAVREKLSVLERVTMESLLTSIMDAHLEHFQAQRRSVLLWFGARQAKAVSERVNARYDYLGSWIYHGGIEAGFVTSETPPWGGEAIVWLADRAFEFIFRSERSHHEQVQIMALTNRMLVDTMVRYSASGEFMDISREEFESAFGPYAPPGADDFA